MMMCSSMNDANCREVLECASPLALSRIIAPPFRIQSGRGLPQSKTLSPGGNTV
jgi:hypothetical protein